ncbi:MAG: capsule biosynthesis protein CapA [Hydrogenophilales bacterium 16-64-46]|nr:MAG: capsule biosynthesis protein CapA [Hydrogenophilales bacterium 12-64-13]OYZ07021.1 MAG: capsule biosynthesis protein CapA [Hydrogenophilales bacterium 16-64-46]OZA37729.1 MAG: capsule biosynthesis protein CapA [Hydrogenophilales bacterium 17-64-34]HQS99321.1 capsular biosynthesis protein [Thiobacillus sp.]
MKRSFLFLQGPSTPFFARLADRLRREGHAVHRINFCAGDALYWGGRRSWWFGHDTSRLREYLDDKYRRYGITDQVLFGDRRPVHRPAVEHGEACGVRTHVFEEGYFRPWWVTLEREGVNGHSLLPRDPDWFREAGARLAETPQAVEFFSPFHTRAIHDVAYHVAGLANPVLFPRYRTHAGVTAPVEYAGYVRRFAWLRAIRRREQRRAREMLASGLPYYLLPLQLNTDAQVRDHSRFGHMGEVIEHVLESFARHAPHDTRILVKNHPLDMGLMNFGRIIGDCERRFDIRGRVDYLEQGDTTAFVSHAHGVVTVNSTVGMIALELGTPTLTLSDPIYNLPGLASQLPLDAFWRNPVPPDQAFFARFRRCVMHATQLNGGFYCSTGIALAVENGARVLGAQRSPLEALA